MGDCFGTDQRAELFLINEISLVSRSVELERSVFEKEKPSLTEKLYLFDSSFVALENTTKAALAIRQQLDLAKGNIGKPQGKKGNGVERNGAKSILGQVI